MRTDTLRIDPTNRRAPHLHEGDGRWGLVHPERTYGKVYLMKRFVYVAVSAFACTGLLAACGTNAECVTVPTAVVDAIKSGNPGTTTYGNYGGVETTIADRKAFVVAVEFESRFSANDSDTGVWRVGWNDNRPGPILAANDWAAAVAEWPRDRDEDAGLVDSAIACV